ncbi:MAG: hypothetical protein EAZ27_06775 [Cytophagales bacterium]|nr:MAG: hypothetical protein EAZ27_06775 [Cytophagales bacterium]
MGGVFKNNIGILEVHLSIQYGLSGNVKKIKIAKNAIIEGNNNKIISKNKNLSISKIEELRKEI